MNATASGAPWPARIQKASLDDNSLVLEVFVGQKRWVVLGLGTLEVVDSKPAAPPERTPPALQGLLRKEALPAMVTGVSGEATLHVMLERLDGKKRELLVERLAADPRVVLAAVTDEGLRVLAVLLGAPRAKDGRDLRRGQLYLEPRAEGPVATSQAPAAAPREDPLAALRAQLRSEHKRQKRLVDALTGDLTRHGDPALHENDGELLKTVLGRLKRGMSSVEVTGFDGEPRTLALEPKRDAKGNLELFFARAKRARTAVARTRPRLEDARKALAHLEDARTRLGAAPSADDVAFVEAVLGAQHETASPRRRVARETAKAGPRKAWRCFVISRDVIVRVGRGAKDNDSLVRDAKGHDVWLHARDRVGAHVVVPSRGDELPDDVLLDAAHLAAHFSAARGERHVDVQVARVKHLRKPGPGAPAGFFHVSEEKVVGVRMDDARIARLLAAEIPA
jgi:NFACT N-terminal and middle domains/NFACT protein RNA binding domain